MRPEQVAPQLEHATSCQQRRPPVLRASWEGSPEWWCPEGGRCVGAAEGVA